MKIHKSITIHRVVEAIEEDDHIGFCISCGARSYGVEPDAEEYDCEICEESSVYGAEELLLYIA